MGPLDFDEGLQMSKAKGSTVKTVFHPHSKVFSILKIRVGGEIQGVRAMGSVQVRVRDGLT